MKVSIVIFLVLIFSNSAFANKKVLMMVPNDFMWPEYALPAEAYKSAGFEVKTAAKFKEPVNPDKRNITKGNSLFFTAFSTFSAKFFGNKNMYAAGSRCSA